MSRLPKTKYIHFIENRDRTAGFQVRVRRSINGKIVSVLSKFFSVTRYGTKTAAFKAAKSYLIKNKVE